MPSVKTLFGIKALVFAIALIPFARLAVLTFTNGLGANPVEFITRATGWWTLFFLCATLAITPLRTIAGLPWLLRLRRMLGLFAFFYVCLHFTTYVWLDREFDFTDLTKDILKRPFITVGFTAFVLLIPLAATSFNRAVKWLGAQNWQKLHRVVYVIVLLGVLHFYWSKMGKNLWVEPAVFAAVVAALLGWRIWQRFADRQASR